MKIEDIGKKVDWEYFSDSKYFQLSNSIKTREDDVNYKYTVVFSNLIPFGNNLTGSFRIEKWKENITFPKKRRKKEEELEPVISWERIWNNSTQYNAKSNDNVYIIENDEIIKSRDKGHRQQVVWDALAYHNTNLSDEFLDKIFNPLEDKILEMYNRMKDFNYEPIK